MAIANKYPVDVEVPERLVHFWRDVVSRIDAKDPSTIYESDDLLQCEFVYGGLADPDNRYFGFTYFPFDEDPDTEWEFFLSESELRLIASGLQQSIQAFRCQDPRCLLMHSAPDGYCPNCDNVLDYVDEFGDMRKAYPALDDVTINVMVAMRRIVHGLLQSTTENHEWPRHAIYSSNDEPILSWRVGLLPYIDQVDLFRRVAVDEPWDSPSNRRLWNEMPSVFRTRSDLALPDTHVTAVIDDNTMWPLRGGRHWRDVRKGTSYTAAVLELTGWATNWMRPDDVTLPDVLRASREESRGASGDNIIVAGMVDGNATPFSGEAIIEGLLIG
ncbi:MAG: hypothetical protein KDB23_09900 [Planctomycetales bacterium]|nr:hypothetical protein [Planctomycetales bacterium]